MKSRTEKVLWTTLVIVASMLCSALPSLGQFTTVGPMDRGRVFHTMTTLDDGRVLVTGGFTPQSNADSSAEIFDPSTGTWRYTLGQMTMGRAGHFAVKLRDGWVLVGGGYGQSGSRLTSVEIFDPVTEQFQSRASMNTPHQGPAAVLLNDGRVIVISGLGSGGSVEIYDPTTNSWTQAASLPSERINFDTVLLPDGSALILGGANGDGQPGIANVTRYCPKSDTWTEMSPLLAPRDGPTATLLPDGRILVAGGFAGPYFNPGLNSAEFYNPVNGSSTSAPAMSFGRYGHTATRLPSGDVLVVGGQTSLGGFTRYFVFEAELYNCSGRTWSSVGTTNFGRSAHRAALLNSGQVLIAGGISDPTYGGAGIAQAEVRPAFLAFPLKRSSPGVDEGLNPYNAPIISVFDHQMTDGSQYHIYGCDGTVQAYTGEKGDKDHGVTDCRSHPGFQQQDTIPFYVNSRYVGNGGDAKRLNYDGHPGFDYGASCTLDSDGNCKIGTGTNVYAAASGTISYPNAVSGLCPTSEDATCAEYHVLQLTPSADFRIYYLHLSTYVDGVNTTTVTNPDQPAGCPANPDGTVTLPWPSGTRVGVGCLIGQSGNAHPLPDLNCRVQNCLGPHLHFEVQKKTTAQQAALLGFDFIPVDPYGWDGWETNCSVGQGDPYECLTGVKSVRLWVHKPLVESISLTSVSSAPFTITVGGQGFDPSVSACIASKSSGGVEHTCALPQPPVTETLATVEFKALHQCDTSYFAYVVNPDLKRSNWKELVGPGCPALAGKLLGQTKNGTNISVDLQLTNNGIGAATKIVISSIVPRTLAGAGTVTYTGQSPPYSLGGLQPGSAARVTLTFKVPPTVKKFSVSEAGTVQDSTGGTQEFAIAKVVFP